jgi:hypothetical protein
MPIIDELPLRQCALAVSVLADIDLTPADDGVVLPRASAGRVGTAGASGTAGVLVRWEALAEAVGGYPTHSEIARHRVTTLLRLHRLAMELEGEAKQRFHSAARVMALPVGHAEHPGASWVQQPLRGNALQLGIGVQGLLDEPDRAVPVPLSVLQAIGVEPADWWPPLREHAERMGALCATRLTRGGTNGVIRPVGGCDVLALLSSRSLRRHLAEGDGSGLRALAIPTRRRGWYDTSHIDPAFVQAAWSLTDELDRGLPRPVLVTSDEVSIPYLGD